MESGPAPALKQRENNLHDRKDLGRTAGALGVIARLWQSRPLTCVGVGAVTALVILGSAISYTREVRNRIPPSEHRPLEQRADGYVSSKTCRACHPREYASWHRSYHRSMTQLAEPSTVRGDFDDVALSLYGKGYRLEQNANGFWIQESSSQGEEESARRVTMVTGSHHFQAYWTERGLGRSLELFPLIFQLAEERWIPFDSLVLSPPGLRQLTGEGGEWNRVCILCHTTGPEPRALEPEAMDSGAAEFGIACESCHGPGENHVRLNQNPLRRYARHFSSGSDESIVNPGRLDPLRSAQVCGQCHAVQDFPGHLSYKWLRDGPSYRAGDDLFDDRVQLTEDIESEYGHTRFWSDGQIRVGGREYPGILASPCFASGEFDCTSCHKLHQAEDDPRELAQWADDQLHAGMRGNTACLQCHGQFETRASLEAHTHHLEDSSGSSCYNCHMPYTAFGLHKATRSHRITNPNVQESLETGRPNACNHCHLDRTLAWSARTIENWWGTAQPQLSKQEREVAASVLWALSGDANQRALVAWSLGWKPALEASRGPGDPANPFAAPDWVIPYLAQLLVDPYPVVRSVAHRSLVRHPGFENLEYGGMGSDSELEASGRRVFERWHSQRSPSEVARPELLLGRGARIEEASFARIMAERDNRPIYLAE